MSMSETPDGRTEQQATLDGGVVEHPDDASGLEGLATILWMVGREHPNDDVHAQVRRAAKRAREQDIFPLSGGEDGA